MVSPEVLRRYPFFAGLNDDELKSIAMIANEERYRKGQFVFEEGAPAKNFYILMEGEVEVAVTIDAASGKREPTSTVGPGEIFCISAMVADEKTTGSVRCMTDIKTVAIDANSLRALFNVDNHLGYVLSQNLARAVLRRLNDTRIQLVSLAAG